MREIYTNVNGRIAPIKVKKINAHHIKRWSDYPGLRYHPSNGITLCQNHHKMIKDMESDYELFFLKLIANKNELS